MAARARKRCAWAGTNPLMIAYHDEEWGAPQHDDRTLFEFVVLEGAQAGLSWSTILNKRARYRQVFHRFDPKKVARYGAADVKRLLADPGIVRNRQKIASAIGNARAFLRVQQEHGSFDRYLWGFVDGAPVVGRGGAVPARTELSDAISRDLKRRGFSFVGSTIVYALLQAVGVVNDHARDCFRRSEVQRAGRTPRRAQRRANASSR